MALLITVGLTVFVLGAGAVIAINVNRTQTTSEGVMVLTPTNATGETLLARDAQYRANLEEANRVIQEANVTIADLQAQQSTLQTQNEALLAREALYQQAIAKANALLQQSTEPQVIAAAPQASVPAAPSYSEVYKEASEHEGERGDND
jgi:hypothetical protein